MRFLFYFLLLLFFSPYSQAQIVNIEDRRAEPTDSSGWFGNVDVRFSLQENGNRIISFGAAFHLEHVANKQRWLAFGTFNQTNINGERFINEGVGHLRYNYELNDWITWEAFGQAQQNQWLRIQFRGLLGTGPRFKLLEKEKQKAYLGTLYMYEYDEVLDTTLTFNDHRLSAYISFKLQPFKNLIISSTNYYQPMLFGFDNTRLSSRTTLQFLLSDHFSFTTSFDITFDERFQEVIPGVLETTYGFNNTLRVKF